MVFVLVLETDARSLPAFILISNPDGFEELIMRPYVETKNGDAYFIDDVKDFMRRYALDALKVCYLPH